MLIGGDDNNIIPLWHVFFNLCLHLCSFPLCLCPGELAHRLPLQEGNRLTEKSTNIVSPPPPPTDPHFLKLSKWNVVIHLIFQLECLVMPCKW